MNKIIIKSAKFLCNVGVSEKERKKKQEIIIDVELFLNSKKTAAPFFLTDDIKDTINYSEVYGSMKKTIESSQHKLIETIAENISQELLNKFNIDSVLVRVKKPAALANRNVKYAAVEVLRKKITAKL